MKKRITLKKMSKQTLITVISIVGFLIFSVLTNMFEEVILFKILMLASAIAAGFVIIPKIIKDDLSEDIEKDYEDGNVKRKSRFEVEDVDLITDK